MLKFIEQNPALFFILSILFYWFSTANPFNPIAITLLIIGVIMTFKQYRPLAVGIGIVFLMINAYLILALFSEFREFPDITSKALLMLGVGGAYIAFNIYISLRLIINNMPKEGKVGQLS